MVASQGVNQTATFVPICEAKDRVSGLKAFDAGSSLGRRHTSNVYWKSRYNKIGKGTGKMIA
jgi:hypothetical protein